jgi:hypothetical protein
LNNREKQRKTEKFIKFLTKSSRVLDKWESVPKFKEDSHTKVDNNSHQVLAFQVNTLNTNNNSQVKEEVDT